MGMQAGAGGTWKEATRNIMKHNCWLVTGDTQARKFCYILYFQTPKFPRGIPVSPGIGWDFLKAWFQWELGA